MVPTDWARAGDVDELTKTCPLVFDTCAVALVLALLAQLPGQAREEDRAAGLGHDEGEDTDVGARDTTLEVNDQVTDKRARRTSSRSIESTAIPDPGSSRPNQRLRARDQSHQWR